MSSHSPHYHDAEISWHVLLRCRTLPLPVKLMAAWAAFAAEERGLDPLSRFVSQGQCEKADAKGCSCAAQTREESGRAYSYSKELGDNPAQHISNSNLRLARAHANPERQQSGCCAAANAKPSIFAACSNAPQRPRAPVRHDSLTATANLCSPPCRGTRSKSLLRRDHSGRGAGLARWLVYAPRSRLNRGERTDALTQYSRVLRSHVYAAHE